MDLVSRFPDEIATMIRGLPTCEVCGANIPGRPGDPDGLCKIHADIDTDWDGNSIPADMAI